MTSRLAALCLVAALATPAGAEGDPAVQARTAIAALEEAAAAQEAARGAQDRVRALTDTVRAYEEGLAALRAGLRDLAARDRALAARLAAQEAELGALLGTLARLERVPEPLLLAHPGGALANARAAMLLGAAASGLAADADALAGLLAELRAVEAAQHAAAGALERGLADAQAARAALGRALADRAALPRPFAADPDRLAALAEAATSLDTFATGLAALERPPQPDWPDAASSREPPSLPLDGTVLRGFREADAAGVARPGIVLATWPGALVTAPLRASVRYVGPLLDYGNVMILEPGAGLLVVLAGLGSVYAAAGQVVLPGDPLAVMGGAAGATQTGAAVRSETLYMEVRQDGVPVDPADWFAIGRQQ